MQEDVGACAEVLLLAGANAIMVERRRNAEEYSGSVKTSHSHGGLVGGTLPFNIAYNLHSSLLQSAPLSLTDVILSLN